MPRPVEQLIHLCEKLGEKSADQYVPEDRALFAEFREAANLGLVRCARRTETGEWQVNVWFKRTILAGFRLGQTLESDGLGKTQFFDKHTLPTRAIYQTNKIRLVPGGSSVRDGAYIGEGVIIMPPSYINIGAYVDADTLVDSHVLVGSCAQVGARVHLSAGVQIGGVLEPVGGLPVVIEDDVIVGGNSGIYEGTIVRERAVIGTGVILNGSTKVFDLVNSKILQRTQSSPLEIPAGAVVVSGTRPAKGDFAAEHGLQIYSPLIVKYRDGKTDAATTLEEALR
ncbi:MAG: 2,3,4,5-tetrahydropyridine-2,6-dicarboxylate N-succinyltransferase [Deltaproteobacteria bacterium]|nr:2,3,4,5-tetrahydropyridine-2,6-dicarboxylate N-succinyltransferase [Deltaproteobacteria bacterium]